LLAHDGKKQTVGRVSRSAAFTETANAGYDTVNAGFGGSMFAEALREAGYAAYRARLNALLGIPEEAGETQIHRMIVEGFPANRLIELCENGAITPVERDQIIPLRTLKTRLHKGQSLTVHESDSLFRAAHIMAMAETIFGDSRKAKRWLIKPKERFDGQSPMDLLATQSGTNQVEEMLLQIAEGYAF